MSGADPGLRYLWLLVLGLLALSVHASHFRGGIIMVRPLPGGGENEVSSIVAEKVWFNFKFNSQTVVDYYSIYVCSLY